MREYNRVKFRLVTVLSSIYLYMLIICIAISFPAQRAARRCCNQITLRWNLGIKKRDGSPALTELYLKQEFNLTSPHTHILFFCIRQFIPQ